MDFNAQVKLAVYRHFAESGRAPAVEALAGSLGVTAREIKQSFVELRAVRVLYLEPDGVTIRMAPPFSGIPTQHTVRAGGIEYFANCAWDVLGIPAALHKEAAIRSVCGQTGEPLALEVGLAGPGPSAWVFHSLVRAAAWWKDIVFT